LLCVTVALMAGFLMAQGLSKEQRLGIAGTVAVPLLGALLATGWLFLRRAAGDDWASPGAVLALELLGFCLVRCRASPIEQERGWLRFLLGAITATALAVGIIRLFCFLADRCEKVKDSCPSKGPLGVACMVLAGCGVTVATGLALLGGSCVLMFTLFKANERLRSRRAGSQWEWWFAMATATALLAVVAVAVSSRPGFYTTHNHYGGWCITVFATLLLGFALSYTLLLVIAPGSVPFALSLPLAAGIALWLARLLVELWAAASGRPMHAIRLLALAAHLSSGLCAGFSVTLCPRSARRIVRCVVRSVVVIVNVTISFALYYLPDYVPGSLRAERMAAATCVAAILIGCLAFRLNCHVECGPRRVCNPSGRNRTEVGGQRQ